MYCEPRNVFLILSFCGLIISAHARSWDFAVLIGREIEFFARNKTLTGQIKIAEAVTLTSVAYDDTTHTMYLSDACNNVSIFSNDLREKQVKPKPIVKNQNKSHILGMVFDTASRTLFWTDSLREVIMKMHVPANGPAEEPVVLHALTNRSPRGIALDVCNRRIYWANSNTTNPSIESSNLDGSDRLTLITEKLYEPVSLAVDHEDGKLYWSDDEEGIHYKIERSNLDGSNRELVVHRQNQQPVYLAVDRELIYWSDWTSRAIWTIPKNVKQNDIPKKFKSYLASKEDDPTGILTRDNVGSSIDCKALLNVRKTHDSLKLVPPPQPTVESYNNLTTSTEEVDLDTDRQIKYCLNDGVLDNSADRKCKCKPGFSGPLCEISICYNYCLSGACVINKDGAPKCTCSPGFSGPRCEKDACDGYCLHDGQCSVQKGKPSCDCKYSRGTRCEILLREVNEICAMVCADVQPELHNLDKSFCRCGEVNNTVANSMSITSDNDGIADNFKYNTLLLILAALVAVLLLTVGVLSYYVNKLRRRPRIKKRFVVRKNGVTPLTSRPQIPDNQCEITIENCCNMNICETPCFEPNLRTTVPRNNSAKKEEKNSLLDNMEGNSC